MITMLWRQTGAALRMLLAATVLLGLAYPLAVWGVARLPGLEARAEGSVLTASDGTPVGSSLIAIDPVPADPAADPWFHTRPSASAEEVLGPGDPSTSGGCNQGGFSEKLLDQVQQRRARDRRARRGGPGPGAPRRRDRLRVRGRPADQPGVRAAAGAPGGPGDRADEATVEQLVADGHRRPSRWASSATPAVNVTRLNLALAATTP